MGDNINIRINIRNKSFYDVQAFYLIAIQPFISFLEPYAIRQIFFYIRIAAINISFIYPRNLGQGLKNVRT